MNQKGETKMPETVKTAFLMGYIQTKLKELIEANKKYGMDDASFMVKLNDILACKEMVETLFGVKIRLAPSGKVFVI